MAVVVDQLEPGCGLTEIVKADGSIPGTLPEGDRRCLDMEFRLEVDNLAQSPCLKRGMDTLPTQLLGKLRGTRRGR